MKKTVKILIMIGLLILTMPCEVLWFLSIPIALFLFWKRYGKAEDRDDFLLSALIGLILCLIGAFLSNGIHHSTALMLSLPIFWIGYCFLIFPVKKENLKQLFSFSNPATKTKKIIISCFSAFYVFVCFVGGSPMVPNQDEVLSADAPVAETQEEKKSEAQLPEEKDTPEPAEAAEPAPVQTQPEPAESVSDPIQSSELVDPKTESIDESLVSKASQETVPPSDNILLQLKKVSLTNGFGEPINGDRAYIRLTKENLKTISEEDYREFLKICEKEYSDCNYVSIMCHDGTGITVTPSFTYQSTYGQMDNTGGITKSFGYIYFEDDSLSYEAGNS